MTVSPLDFGATADGVSDDSGPIEAAINTGESVDLGGAENEYTITRPIFISVNGQHVFGTGAGISFGTAYDTEMGTSLRMIQVEADEVEIYGIRFDMVFPSQSVPGGKSFGIRFMPGVDRGGVSKCTFRNQQLRSLASVATGSTSKDIIVDRCTFYATSENHGGGAILHSGSRCIATNNIIKDLGDSFISLDDSNGSIVSGNTLINDLATGGVLRQVGAMIQVAHGSSDCVVSSNSIKGVTSTGIYSFNSVSSKKQSHNKIIGNTLNGGGDPDINRQTVKATVMIAFDSSTQSCTISDNDMYNFSNVGTGSYGIYSTGTNNKQRNNDVSAPPEVIPIKM